MSAEKNADAYLTTKVLTASPEELRLLLLEGAIRFTRRGRDALAAKDYAAVCDAYARARDVILELINSMRPEVAPELCKQISGLYMFVYRLLVESSLERDVAKGDRALELLEYERETWILLMEKLAKERADAGVAREQLARHAERREYTPLSIAG